MRFPILTATLLSAPAVAVAHPDTHAAAHTDLGLIGSLVHLLAQHYAPLLLGALVVALLAAWRRQPQRGHAGRNQT